MNLTLPLQKIIELTNAHRSLYGIETQGLDGETSRVLPKTFDMDGRAKLTVILNSAALQVKAEAFNETIKDRRKKVFAEVEAAQKRIDDKKKAGGVILKEETDFVDDMKSEANKAWQQEFNSLLETTYEITLEPIYLTELKVTENDYDPFAVATLLNAGVITQADRKEAKKAAAKPRA